MEKEKSGMESVREWPEVQNQSQGNLVWVVTEAKEREHFRERVATIAERLRAGTKKKKEKEKPVDQSP